ncbi:aminotransferase class I/II-fold pyridoxal phosphate-dependent enzyme [Acidovorax sp. NCPPB 4044]|uniref:aminotransferase class I/II-fold pyridoxal phosphate-dependent enzyme n=1 Tax=Acidovorax sp. NCPPB 4044 TaxID=2940490 RepID=UPI0023030295|nr:aminotransferase class I/II-fold pyridoxal phosphate-dependent enzyme [Acidovorax sp. NCPPB 4044]MDA8523323.1 aminotransferase class I/II-fold pyridoxal phosphate-dependent enzyme [Acidovorax sp. NCPPB 4044]
MKSWSIKGASAAQIAASIEESLRSGAMVPGDALPAVRALADRLGVNPNTVAAAYARLRDAGRLQTDGRRGTRVAEPLPSALPGGQEIPALPAGLRDLAGGDVDTALLPRLHADAWPGLLSGEGYGGPAEAPAWREVAHAWLARQGLPAEATGVYSGTLDVVERALRLHARAGDRVALEDPCWPPMAALVQSLRLRPVPLPVDAQGARVPPAEVLDGCAAIVLTPRAHNPTGCALSEPRWRALRRLLLARPHLLCILDDYWGPLSQEPLAPAGALPPLWLYVLSAGKFLGPDLRVALAAGPPALMQALRAQQAAGPRWVSRLLQVVAAGLWRNAEASGQLARAGQAYARRRHALEFALRSQPQAQLPLPPVGGEGLHVWVPVDNEATVLAALAARGWAAQAGAPFRIASGPAVRLSLGGLQGDEVGPLARDLAAALAPLPGRAVF